MEPPSTQVTVDAATSGVATRPTGGSGANWEDIANAYDSDASTFASTSLAEAGLNILTVSGFASDTSANRRLYVKYRLASFQMTVDGWVEDFGAGGGFAGDFIVGIVIRYSTDEGSTWTDLWNGLADTAMSQYDTVQTAIPDAVNSDKIWVRARIEYAAGDNQASLRVADVKLQTGALGTTLTDDGGLIYAVTEYDATRGLESDPGPESAIINVSGAAGSTVNLPTSAKNATTTNYRVYRTHDGGTFPDHLGLAGTAPVGQGFFFDDYDALSVDTQAYPPLPMMDVTVQGGVIRYPQNHKPPAAYHQNVFENTRVIVPVSNRSRLRYCIAGLPESAPEHYIIANLPFLKNDEVVATLTVGRILLIFAEDAVAKLNELPLQIDANFDARAELFMSDHGLVGPKALVAFDSGSVKTGAWVSRDGVWLTNGNTARRITDHYWQSGAHKPNQATLDTAVLTWDSSNDQLVLAYDSDGDSVNDRIMLINMNPQHLQRNNGQPKITVGGYAKVNDFDSGIVGGVFRLYAAHETDGKVYLEQNGTTDASNAYDSNGTLPVKLTSAKVYGNYDYYSVSRGSLRTTDFGSGQTATITHTAGKDNPVRSSSQAKSVSVAGEGGREFAVMRNGEWHQFTIDYTGNQSGAFKDIRLKIATHGDAGTVGNK
jgi:hypothetical protein